MPKLIILGTAASVPNGDHDTIGLALCGPDWAVLIDCGGSPLHKLARFGVEPEQVRAVLLSHRHADHLYGLPMLIQGLWLDGRQEPLPLYGPQEAIEVARSLLALFDLDERDDLFALEWHPIPPREARPVLEIGGIRISASPVAHFDLDTRAFRFLNVATGRTIVYSADTGPSAALVRLATGAELLIHEATGAGAGHTTPEEAAEIARQAGVAELALIHYPVRGVDLDAWRRRAAGFPGPVSLARDGDIYYL
jgi:ribonuclease Z